MSAVTRSFSELSKEVIACIAAWEEQGLSAIATILSQLQVQEKEKLELVRRSTIHNSLLRFLKCASSNV